MELKELKMRKIGVIIIGRNEGERLKSCIRSVCNRKVIVVYVDSGSEDDSIRCCRQHDVKVIELDMSIPFSAGRARNTGMRWLMHRYPKLDYIQFIDGDCELIEGWFERATQHLQENVKLAIVCGRRMERYPQRSIYNQLCDVEWNTAVGITDSCGGDFMARIPALKEVDGFNPAVIAGEEPDLCYRLRLKGWQIERVEVDMTRHDAMILRFAQWWRRTIRSGHAYAHNMVLHWGGTDKNEVRNVLSIIVWGLAVPSFLCISILLNKLIVALLISILYLFMMLKISSSKAKEKTCPSKITFVYAFFTMLGKMPQSIGVLQFFSKLLRSKKFKIIEYK